MAPRRSPAASATLPASRFDANSSTAATVVLPIGLVEGIAARADSNCPCSARAETRSFFAANAIARAKCRAASLVGSEGCVEGADVAADVVPGVGGSDIIIDIGVVATAGAVLGL